MIFIILKFSCSPPNLKTVTPLSRTQLKQQLMREQALQEQQRQAQLEAQKLSEEQQQKSSPVMRVPLHSLSLEVPPQILQVCPFYIFKLV